jgi:hypothetical protein
MIPDGITELQALVVLHDPVPGLGRQQRHQTVRSGGRVAGDHLGDASETLLLHIALADIAEHADGEQAEQDLGHRPRPQQMPPLPCAAAHSPMTIRAMPMTVATSRFTL